MGRPLTGKLHTGQRRETRANGDVYVYERVTAYDPKTQKTKTVSTRLLGKIPAGQTEMIPTRPKKTKTSARETQVQARRVHGGLLKLLSWIGDQSGIDADLMKSFSEGDAQKLISIARYWLSTDGEVLPRLQDWQAMNPLPYPGRSRRTSMGTCSSPSAKTKPACSPTSDSGPTESARTV